MAAERPLERCLIVGAGMTGLTAARLLKENAVKPIVLEGSRGLGGRMATRRIDSGVFDHGAQFLTARDPRFQQMLVEWETGGLVREWCQGFPADTGPRLCDGHVRYKVVGGMTALAKHLARGLDIRRGNRVVELVSEGSRWRALSETGETVEGDALILTPPIPQVLELLDSSGCKISEPVRKFLAGVTYDPCITVMALLSQPSGLPDPGAVRFSDGPLAFLADNHVKGISARVGCVTIQSGAEFARGYWDSDENVVIRALLGFASKWIDPKQVQEAQVKRWRYSTPLDLYAEPCLVAGQNPPLILAGDAFGGPRVEGAALSGLSAAAALLGEPMQSRG